MAPSLSAGVREVQARLAEGFVAGVRATPPARLEQLMDTPPARRAILEAIFRQMPRALDRRRARGVDLAVRWVITGNQGRRRDVYDLWVTGNRASVRRGGGEPAPKVTITVDGAEFLRLVSGNADPMRAYLAGDLSASGDIMAAARLVSLFRMPGARRGRKQNANTSSDSDRAY